MVPSEPEVVPLRESTVVRVGTLSVDADEVIVTKREPKPPAEIVRRYRWNSVLLAAVAILLVLWFDLHLRTWATEKILFGTATVWALFQLVRAWTPKNLAEDAESLRERFLARRGTREHLLFALSVAVALLFFTSSVYLALGDRSQPRVRIEIVDSGGALFMDSLSVEPSARIAGRLFVPRFRTKSLQVIVREPANYVYLHNPLLLKPWSAAELTFGDATQFGRNALHAVRIVPGPSLNEIDAPGRPVRTLTVTTTSGRFVFRPVTFQTLYLGVEDRPSLQRIAEQQTNDAFTDLLNRSLEEQAVDESVRGEYVTRWRTSPRLEPTRNFREGEPITVSIGIDGAPPEASATVPVGAGEITTIVLESKR